MDHDRIIPLLNDFRSQHKSYMRPLVIALIGVLAVVEAFIVFGVNASAGDRATIAAALFAVDTIAFAGWQWWEQRRQTTTEAYFTRLDIPNQRRLSFYEQLAGLGLDKEERARVLEQFYVFYVYAELDNFEYAMRKYSNGSISGDLAERAAKTFITRCQQSDDFRRTVCAAVTQSGYPSSFERLVRRLAVCPKATGDGQQLHPMQYNELDIIHKLRPTP